MRDESLLRYAKSQSGALSQQKRQLVHQFRSLDGMLGVGVTQTDTLAARPITAAFAVSAAGEHDDSSGPRRPPVGPFVHS